LVKLSQQRPQDPAVWFKLAEVNGFNGNSVGIHLASAEYLILNGGIDQALEQLDYALRKSDKNFQLTTKIEQRRSDIKDYQEFLKKF
jgi:predicted Zn-dependent protease